MTHGKQVAPGRGVAAGTLIGLAIGLIVALLLVMTRTAHLPTLALIATLTGAAVSLMIVMFAGAKRS